MTEFLSAATPLVATTFELLPQRLDLAEIVLTVSGLGALVGALGAALSGMGRRPRVGRAEKGALIGAGVALAVFVVLYLAQEIR